MDELFAEYFFSLCPLAAPDGAGSFRRPLSSAKEGRADPRVPTMAPLSPFTSGLVQAARKGRCASAADGCSGVGERGTHAAVISPNV